KKYPLPKNTTAERANHEHNQVVLIENIGTQNRKCGVFDFVAQKTTVPCSFWDLKHWRDGIYKASFSYSEHAYVNGNDGQNYFDIQPGFEIKNNRGVYQLIDKFTGKPVFDDSFDHIQAI